MDIIIHVTIGEFKVNIESGKYHLSDESRGVIEAENYESFDSSKKFDVYNKVSQKFWRHGMGN